MRIRRDRWPGGRRQDHTLERDARNSHPTESEVLVGGLRVRDVGLDAMRAMVGTVLQDDVLFAGSIAENISFFDPAANPAWIEKCASLPLFRSAPRSYFSTRPPPLGARTRTGRQRRHQGSPFDQYHRCASSGNHRKCRPGHRPARRTNLRGLAIAQLGEWLLRRLTGVSGATGRVRTTTSQALDPRDRPA